MNEQDLRKLIRASVERHLAARGHVVPPGGDDGPAAAPAMMSPGWQEHASHAVYVTLVNAGDDCLIEPSVACNHCGYCKSHGH